MKIGTSTKITIGVIGVIVAGFIGFQIVTHQPDVKLPGVETQQPIAKSKVRQSQEPVSKVNSRLNESEKAIQDEQDIDEVLAWFDALKQLPPMESQEISEQEEEGVATVESSQIDQEVPQQSSETDEE